MLLTILAMIGVVVLFVVGVMAFAMIVLHRKPHNASAEVTRERRAK